MALFSNLATCLSGEETAVELALDLLAMDLTNDPDPVRSGAGITVRHGFVTEHIEKERKLKRQINRIRKKIINI